MKNKKKFRELHGKEYVELYKNKTPLRLERLVKYMMLDSIFSVADFACGNGILMEVISPKVKSYIGIDNSELFIKAANEKKEELFVKNADFVCSDINEFCMRHKKTFDVGFAMDFSEHVHDKEWVKILGSIRRSLKPNGKFFLHTPNAEFFIEKMKSKNFIFKQFPEHIAVRTPEHNAYFLREAGYNEVQVRLIPHYNILRIVHPLSYIPILGKYFKARIFIEATTL
ncbi:MAG: class I SAM-dependent methyltransferase [Bacteroidales bacterium]|nr:class I SAM-dependent methyltransferase [Bacteroidales bacterium]